MSLDYTSLQAWILARAVRPELTAEVVRFIAECESMIRRKLDALETRATLTDTDRVGTTGRYNLSGLVRSVRAAYATDASGMSYPLENVGVAGIRQLRDDADVYHYAVSAQTIEFRGVPAAGASLELLTIGWPAPLSTTASNELLTNYEDVYTFGATYFLRLYEEDLENANIALGVFTRAVEELNKVTRTKIGGGSVLPTYNFGQISVSRRR